MLGLGSNISKTGKLGVHDLGIVTSNLVLKHNYDLSSVQPLSSGAADINADAAADEYIDVGVIPITTNDVSISVWVYITTWVNYAGIVVNRSSSGTNPGLELRCANGAQKFQLVIDDANGSSSGAISSTLNSNQWYHVCGVWDRSGDMSLYIDGVLDGTDDITGNPLTLTHSTATKIGQASTTEMRGYVCNVGYWNAALTQPQIKSIMWKDYAGLSDSEKTDLVSWWNLDSAVVTGHTDHPFVYDNHYGGGDELGSEMWDGENGSTTNWVQFGSNEIVTDDSAVKITFVDNASGWYIYLKDANQLNADLVIGKRYKMTLSTKVDSGSVLWKIQETGDPTYAMPTPVTSTEFVQQSMYFTASHATGHYFYPSQHLGVDNGVSVWVKDISIKQVNGNTGTLS